MFDASHICLGDAKINSVKSCLKVPKPSNLLDHLMFDM